MTKMHDIGVKNGSYQIGSAFTVDPRDHDNVTGKFHPKTELYHSLCLIGRQYPRIYRRIARGWGTRSLHDYLTSLMIGDSEHPEGFSMDAANAIMAISLQHGTDHEHIFTKG